MIVWLWLLPVFFVLFLCSVLFSSYGYMISSSENVFQVRKRKLYLPLFCLLYRIQAGMGRSLDTLVQPHLTCVVYWVLASCISTWLVYPKKPRFLSRTSRRILAQESRSSPRSFPGGSESTTPPSPGQVGQRLVAVPTGQIKQSNKLQRKHYSGCILLVFSGDNFALVSVLSHLASGRSFNC